ncbi:MULTISPECIES: signal recognition particle-docking protein FtsY [Jonquetella]|uniref:Signal recognition particle receptor FtsY n=1 Tax=Jonquetella anthropi DSM 22815 TaxID=885272 RepID=H0UL48_9BACT|nr:MULTISPECIES: signal recognition particle-docking protein FtsY [Jonquetella]EEX47970.1 signal recognition particle-docking protein FtsY [Jonquetella anthropi E3_33 E1]EHM13407.1 signal recognition particle-docking protein FtsY [Jonquetella anthropi DSM 22815]ERL24938.1 signal recognition particle-docking protein FtsY [Jonquetella sp. BV3C21]
MVFGGFFDRLSDVRRRWSGSLTRLFTRSDITPQFWDDLEETLIVGDAGVDTAEELVASLKETGRREGIKRADELLEAFARLLVARLSAADGTGQPLRLASGLNVCVMVGVNGSGKTTTAGKLACQFVKAGHKVMMAASDTFRAGASEQLQVWGERCGVRVVAQKPGSDPASVAFDGITAAQAAGARLLIVDTAGRLQSRQNLMAELGKIWRVVERAVGKDHVETLIVLDAMIGQNAFVQADLFGQVAPLTGAVLAKYDNTAKGGVVLSITEKLGVPVRYVGVGEGVADLALFEPESFVRGLLGLAGEKE